MGSIALGDCAMPISLLQVEGVEVLTSVLGSVAERAGRMSELSPAMMAALMTRCCRDRG